MKLTAQVLSVVLLALFLQACQLGEDDADDGEITSVVYTTDDGEATIDSTDTYEMLIKANDTLITLKDDISKITVQGSLNYITVDSDTAIDSINITGDDNIIEVKSGVELTVTDVTIQGNGNTLTVYDVVNAPVLSSDGDESINIITETSGS